MLIATLLGLVQSATAQTKTTATLRTEVNNLLKNNTSRQISAEKLRSVFVLSANAIDSIYTTLSLADGLGTYNATSGVASIKETGQVFTPVALANQAKGKYFDVVVAGTQSITGAPVQFQVGGKIISRGTKWDYLPPFIDAYTKAQADTIAFTAQQAFWIGYAPIDFNFTTQVIGIPSQGFWAKSNQFYNNNLVLSGSPPGATKTVNMPGASLASLGINYFFADFKTGNYYCVNYLNRLSVPKTATLIATWYDADGKELTYFSPSSFARKGTTIASYGITDTYTKTQLDGRDRWLQWQFNVDPVFNFTAKTITIPKGGYWLLDKTYYNTDLTAGGASLTGTDVVINMSTANSGGFGINYLFADLAGKQYYARNQTELTSSNPPAGSVVIATWFGPNGDYLAFRGLKASAATRGTINLASEAERLAGTDNSKAVTSSLLAKSTQSSRAFWVSDAAINFDFTAKTITIPANGYWSKGADYYNNNLAISTTAPATTKVINMPASMPGINFFFADFSTATYYCVNYPDRNTIPASATLIATWWNAFGAELTYFSPTIFAKKATTVAGYGITDAYTKTEVDAKVSAFSEPIMRLIAPSRLFLIDSIALPIYKSSIVPVSAGLGAFKYALIEKDNANGNVPRYRYGYEDLTVDASALKPSVSIGLAQTGNQKSYIQPLTISRVTKSSINGKAAKVLMIGNSLTNRSLPAEVKVQIGKFGGNLTMLGTMANTGGQSGEGREGWEFENYIGKDNTHGNGTVIVPSSANPSNLYVNPFLKIATASDKTNHPDWCFRNTGSNGELSYTTDADKTGDFYIFDFANYVSQTGLSAPDVVTLELGTNDILQDGITEAVPQSLLALEVMVNQIKAAYPAVKIGVVPGTVRGVTATGNIGWADTCVMIENIMQKVKSLSATYTNLSVIPAWIHQNRDFNFPVTTAVLSAVNDTQVSTVSDQVHWNDEGRLEYAMVIASYLANIL